MVVGPELIGLGLRDRDNNAIRKLLDVFSFEEVVRVELPAGLRHHVGRPRHGLEQQLGRGFKDSECLGLNAAIRVVWNRLEKVVENSWSYGEGLLDLVLGLPSETRQGLSERSVRGWSSAI